MWDFEFFWPSQPKGLTDRAALWTSYRGDGRIDAAKLARITVERSLVSEWQGRELVKSAAYPQLSENDLSPTGE